jgi:hypothetical protein
MLIMIGNEHFSNDQLIMKTANNSNKESVKEIKINFDRNI